MTPTRTPSIVLEHYDAEGSVYHISRPMTEASAVETARRFRANASTGHGVRIVKVTTIREEIPF